jgi:hypothetical protein
MINSVNHKYSDRLYKKYSNAYKMIHSGH